MYDRWQFYEQRKYLARKNVKKSVAGGSFGSPTTNIHTVLRKRKI